MKYPDIGGEAVFAAFMPCAGGCCQPEEEQEMQTINTHPRRKNQRGQSMVEFALAFPIFLLIVLGIFEFGRLFVTYTSVYAAAREGARYGAATDNIDPAACGSGIEAEAERAGFLAGDLTVTTKYEIFDTDLKWVSGDCSDANAGDRVVVTASMPFKFITGFIPGVGPINITSTAKRTIIKRVYLEWTLAPASTSNPNFTPPAGTPGTPTVTTTVTATPTDLPACNAASISGWTSGTSPYTVTLYNSGVDPYSLDSIIVYWERESSELVEMTITGNGSGDPWSGEIGISPATVDLSSLNWEITNGASYVTITFDGPFSNAQFKGVEINMTAADGTDCTIP